MLSELVFDTFQTNQPKLELESLVCVLILTAFLKNVGIIIHIWELVLIKTQDCIIFSCNLNMRTLNYLFCVLHRSHRPDLLLVMTLHA